MTSSFAPRLTIFLVTQPSFVAFLLNQSTCYRTQTGVPALARFLSHHWTSCVASPFLVTIIPNATLESEGSARKFLMPCKIPPCVSNIQLENVFFAAISCNSPALRLTLIPVSFLQLSIALVRSRHFNFGSHGSEYLTGTIGSKYRVYTSSILALIATLKIVPQI